VAGVPGLPWHLVGCFHLMQQHNTS
jgi:hypothetical protein